MQHLSDATLIISPVVAAPVRPSGHVRPRLHFVQRREAVWLQVSLKLSREMLRVNNKLDSRGG